MMESMSTMKGELEIDSGISFLGDTQRVLGTSFWIKHSRIRREGINSTGSPWWESICVWVCEGQESCKVLRVHTLSVSRMAWDMRQGQVSWRKTCVIEWNYAFATDTSGVPKISMMVATDSIHGSISAVVTRRKDGQEKVSKITSMGWEGKRQNWSVGRSQALLMRQILWFNGINLELFERKLETLKTSEFVNSGTASDMSRSRLNEIRDRSWTGSLVDWLEGTTFCIGCKEFPTEEIRENALSSYLEQGAHWRSCAMWRSVHGTKWFWVWSQDEHEGDTRSCCRQVWSHRVMWQLYLHLVCVLLSRHRPVSLWHAANKWDKESHPCQERSQYAKEVSLYPILTLDPAPPSISTHCSSEIERNRQVSQQPHQMKKWFSRISCRIVYCRTRGIVTLLSGDSDPLISRVCDVRTQVCSHVCRTINR